MPPKGTHGARNARPAFKPPRPVAATSAAGRGSSATGAISSEKTTGALTASSSASNSDSAEDAVDNAAASDSEADSDAQVTERPTDPAMREEQSEISPKLLSRLMHEHFQHDDTRVTKEAMAVLCKYIELFTREAVSRANMERDETGPSRKGQGDEFLDVEDLEKLAPQLLMDF